MTDELTCDQAMETLTARLAAETGASHHEGAAGAADAAEDRALERHLERCPRCREEAGQTRALWQRLGVLEEPEGGVPSTELRARFYSMLAGAKAELDGTDAADRSAHPAGRGADRVAAPGAADRSRPGRLLAWPRRLVGSEVTRLGQLAAAASVLVAILAGAVTVGWWLGRGGGSGGDLESLRAEVRSLHEMVALSLLEQPMATDRLRGVSFGARLDHPDRPVVAALVDAVVRDPNVNVRLAAIDALAPVATDPMVREALIRALPHQDAPTVQIALADLLLDHGGDAQGDDARRAVTSLLDDPTLRPEVRSYLGQRLGRSI